MGHAVDGVRVVRPARVLAGTVRVGFRLVIVVAAAVAGMVAAGAVAGAGIGPRARWAPHSASSRT